MTKEELDMPNAKGLPGKTLIATSAPDGPIDAVTTLYRQWGNGGRNITLDGLQPELNGSSRGVQIDFPSSAGLGQHTIPQGFPNTYSVNYFRQVGSARQSFPAKSGTLTLESFSTADAEASGKFDVVVTVESTDYTLTGNFDIKA